MDGPVLGACGVIVMLVLMAARVPIAFSLMGVAFVGIWIERGSRPALAIMRDLPYEFTAHWTLTAIPMFLLMGSIVASSGLTNDLFGAMRAFVGRLRGGLAIATNFAGAGFAAASGSSLATTATLGRIAVPEMLKQKYDPGLATGVASAVGTLGAIIPPSIMMVVYAIFAEVSAGRMLVAGILPGLLTAFIYASMIAIRCHLKPDLAPKTDELAFSLRAKMEALARIWPLLVLVLGVVGGIYTGIVSPTEAGAFGVILSFVIALLRRRLSLDTVTAGLGEAVRTTASILLIAVGALMFTRFLALTGLPAEIAKLVEVFGGNQIGLILVTSVIYLVLGCFLDPLGVLLLTLPIILPMFDAAGVDPIWVGVILVKFLEIGLLTPPLGLNVFVMKNVIGDGIALGTIFRGVIWFLAAEVVVMTLLIAFPAIILFLPSLMQ